MNGSTRSWPAKLAHVIATHPSPLLILALAGTIAGRPGSLGPGAWSWDPVVVSGLAMVALFAELTPVAARRSDAAFVRALGGRIPAARLARIVRKRHVRALRYGRVAGLALAVAVGAWSAWAAPILIGLPLSVLGYVVGQRLGAAAALGPLGWLLDRDAAIITRPPDAQAHVLGEQLGAQTIVMALPVVYFAAWAVMIHAGPAAHAEFLLAPFTTLFAASVVAVMIGFLFPLLAFATELWARR